jgi:hypothetical protein
MRLFFVLILSLFTNVAYACPPKTGVFHLELKAGGKTIGRFSNVVNVQGQNSIRVKLNPGITLMAEGASSILFRNPDRSDKVEWVGSFQPKSEDYAIEGRTLRPGEKVMFVAEQRGQRMLVKVTNGIFGVRLHSRCGTLPRQDR